MDQETKRYWDWPSAICLLLALLVVAFRIRFTNWTPQLSIIEVIVFLGVVLGLLLGVSKFNEDVVNLMGLAYTLFVIPWQLALSISDITGNVAWLERLTILARNLTTTTSQFLNNKPVQDNILFVASMSLLFWLISLMAGFQLVRNGKPWMPLFVAGMGLLIIDYFNPFLVNRDLYVALYVLFLLLMLGRMYFISSRMEWKEKGISIDSEINFNLGRTLLVTGLALVLVAWNVPAVVDAFTPGTPIQQFLTTQWDKINKYFSNAVVNLNSPAVVSSDFYGDSLSLGTGSNLGDEILFTVQVTPANVEGARYYWRGHSYDLYKAGQWTSTFTETQSVPVGQVPFKYAQYADRKDVTFTVMMRNSILRTVYIYGAPQSFSRAVNVVTSPNGDGTVDLIGVIGQPALRANESFRVVSSIPVPTIKDLSAADTNYPAWVTQYYLQVPSDLPSRVRSLARTIVAGNTTQFDKVMAVTNWLRLNITYEDTVPNPPANRDVIDWFLFDYKKGFCNYYATSEVLMLRSLGIPARLSVGYAEGESEATGDLFTVRSRESHAWPEVFFPGYGWIEFEPTVSQPPTGILSDASSATGAGSIVNQVVPPPYEEELNPSTSGQTVANSNLSNPIKIIILVPSIALFGIGLFYLIHTGKLSVFLAVSVPTVLVAGMEKRGIKPPNWLSWAAKRARLKPIERSFEGVGWMMRLLGNGVQPNFTPFEQISLLTQLLPESRKPAFVLLEEYQKAIYSPHPADLVVANAAYSELWRSVGKRWIKQRFKRAE